MWKNWIKNVGCACTLDYCPNCHLNTLSFVGLHFEYKDNYFETCIPLCPICFKKWVIRSVIKVNNTLIQTKLFDL